MKIFGLDFTSVPTRKKPITCAACELHEDLLQVKDFLRLSSFEEFEVFLASDGPWLAALDFPFGQPRKLLANLGWPQTWEGYVQTIASMGKKQFEETLTSYRATRPAGDKLHLRVTDAQARARSPMMLHRIPVGKMFFQGAPRLLASTLSILPCRPTEDNRIIVEGYPALVARKFIGKSSYKSDEPGKQTIDKALARERIISSLRSQKLPDSYGFSLKLSDEMAKMLTQDGAGDHLDALLCAIQAAWAYSQRNNGYGIPTDCDRDEGWIVDPAML